jgi:formylmethanofuran dehydrogenase subunit C
VSDGLVARLRSALPARIDLTPALPARWTALGATDLARHAIRFEGRALALGDLFDITGEPAGRIRLVGDLRRADGVGAGLSEGEIVVEGSVGDDAGLGMSGGTLVVRGSAGDRTGGAAPEARKGMTGGEIIVHGNVGAETGTRIRRGLIAIGGRAGPGVLAQAIAGTAVVFGGTGTGAALGSKRGSLVALGRIAVPATYRYACTYHPAWLKLLLTRLRLVHGLKVRPKHLSGAWRRYSGDLADIGKGEILEWTAK